MRATSDTNRWFFRAPHHLKIVKPHDGDGGWVIWWCLCGHIHEADDPDAARAAYDEHMRKGRDIRGEEYISITVRYIFEGDGSDDDKKITASRTRSLAMFKGARVIDLLSWADYVWGWKLHKPTLVDAEGVHAKVFDLKDGVMLLGGNTYTIRPKDAK